MVSKMFQELKINQYKLDLTVRILKWCEKFRNVAFCFSGGKDSLVVLDLISKIPELKKKIIILSDDPIMTQEYYEYCKEVLESYGFKNIHWLRNYITKEDWEYSVEKTKDVVMCCYHLKILPVKRFIKENRIENVIIAIRSDEHRERSKEKYVSLRSNEDFTYFRTHPILHWCLKDVWTYIINNKLKINPMYFQGYTSLQCLPCLKKLPIKFNSLEELVEYSLRYGERQVRIEEKEVVMELLRRMGYF